MMAINKMKQLRKCRMANVLTLLLLLFRSPSVQIVDSLKYHKSQAMVLIAIALTF